MALLSGWAETACRGVTAALTATVLMMSAAAMATKVRVNCDDIFFSLFGPAVLACGLMAIANQGACQWRKTTENHSGPQRLVDFPN